MKQQGFFDLFVNNIDNLQVVKNEDGTWDKFYSVYMFDNFKYHRLFKSKKNTNRNDLKKQCYVVNEDGFRIHLGDEKHIFRYKTLKNIQNELAKYCNHLKQKLDIFSNDTARVETEYFILYYERYDKGSYTHELAKKPQKEEFKQSENDTQLSLFADFETKSKNTKQKNFRILKSWDYYEFELKNTWQKSIKERLKLHIEVLRLCRKGESIENASKTVFQRYIIKEKEED